MDELLDEVRRLPPIKQRAVAAFMGALVGDAAGMFKLCWDGWFPFQYRKLCCHIPQLCIEDIYQCFFMLQSFSVFFILF